MRREDLEERLDTEVTVTLFDGSEYTGVCHLQCRILLCDHLVFEE